MTQRILVTGATGFIGGHLCDSLAADGNEVVALTRRTDAVAPSGGKVEIVSDLLDRAAVRSALDGVTAVVHLAARVHAKPEGLADPGSECHRINVDGTVALLEEAVAAGANTFVYISSVKAVAGTSTRRLTAQTLPEPVEAYGASKLEAERRVRAIAMKEAVAAPILRLPAVYGPGMKGNLVRLFWAVDRGLPLPFGLVRNRRSFAYVGNVVAAIKALLTSAAAAHQTFYVSDGEDLSTPQLIQRIGTALGKQPRMFPVPEVAFTAAGQLGGLLSRIAPFNLTGDSLSAVLGSLFVDTSSLSGTTGFVPPFSVDKGMSLTAEWYKASGAGR
ncbi:MAG TPA: NAD-dependent epimerase/dehydratase family protein [Gemmatimonadaceae bacterium]|nr:NAD-dependent epimerase/dehydratase family protein [Gemmatimonadaceae bacterium]